MNGSSSEALDFMEWFCGPLKTRCVPEEAVFGTEYLFRTVEACFLHRMLPKMRRVPQEAFFDTECVFRTVGGRFWYRVPSREQGKGPPETSSALTGPMKWRMGPERTKRAESSQKQIAAEVIVFGAVFIKKVGNPAATTRDVKKSSWCALANEMRK